MDLVLTLGMAVVVYLAAGILFIGALRLILRDPDYFDDLLIAGYAVLVWPFALVIFGGAGLISALGWMAQRIGRR